MQANNTPSLPVKIPFQAAASLLSHLADAIEFGQDITPIFIEHFNDSKLSLADAVDRRIAFDSFIKGIIDQAKQAEEAWHAKRKELEKAYDIFKRNTQEVIEANPGIPYIGKLGKLAVQASPPAVDYSFEEYKLDDALISYLEIDSKYYVVEKKYRINKQKILTDLKNGVELPWARLKQAKHLRIRK